MCSRGVPRPLSERIISRTGLTRVSRGTQCCGGHTMPPATEFQFADGRGRKPGGLAQPAGRPPGEPWPSREVNGGNWNAHAHPSRPTTRPTRRTCWHLSRGRRSALPSLDLDASGRRLACHTPLLAPPPRPLPPHRTRIPATSADGAECRARAPCSTSPVAPRQRIPSRSCPAPRSAT